MNKTQVTCWTESRPVANNIALSKAHFKYYFYFLLLLPTEVTCTSLVCLINSFFKRLTEKEGESLVSRQRHCRGFCQHKLSVFNDMWMRLDYPLKSFTDPRVLMNSNWQISHFLPLIFAPVLALTLLDQVSLLSRSDHRTGQSCSTWSWRHVPLFTCREEEVHQYNIMTTCICVWIYIFS